MVLIPIGEIDEMSGVGDCSHRRNRATIERGLDTKAVTGRSHVLNGALHMRYI